MTEAEKKLIAAAKYVAIFNWGNTAITEDYHRKRIAAMNVLRAVINENFLDRRDTLS